MRRLCALLAAVLLLVGCARSENGLTVETFAMNTICRQTVYGSEAVVQGNNARIVKIEQKMSRTIEGSDIWRINHSTAGQGTAVDSETAGVLRQCLRMREETGGAFNPALGALVDAWDIGGEGRVPSSVEIERLLQMAGSPAQPAVWMERDTVYTNGAQLDLGGAVKGHALDALREEMTQAGLESALISMGGSIYAHGRKPDGSAWKIGIRNPEGSAEDFVCTLELVDECISTSGAYERGFEQNGVYYHHILNPATGYPAENGLLSVSVVDRSGLMTDILSTALYVMGLEDGLAYAERQGYSAVFITQDREIVTSKDFGRRLEVKDSAYRQN